jgi:hypothetical protein
MKHELTELYTYNSKTYTADALSKVIGKDITTMKLRELRELGCARKHCICNYNTPSKASFEYITINGVKTAWQFGEKTFFDTEEERDATREEYRQTREQMKYRNELLKKIQELSTEELEKIIKNI